eukprot:271191-Pelagomonas_calceolata.AAC.3
MTRWQKSSQLASLGTLPPMLLRGLHHLQHEASDCLMLVQQERCIRGILMTIHDLLAGPAGEGTQDTIVVLPDKAAAAAAAAAAAQAFFPLKIFVQQQVR